MNLLPGSLIGRSRATTQNAHAVIADQGHPIIRSERQPMRFADARARWDFHLEASVEAKRCLRQRWLVLLETRPGYLASVQPFAVYRPLI